MKSLFKPAVAGVLFALLAIRTFYLFTSPISYQLFALFLAYTACVYLGAALSDSRMKWISVEFWISLLFFTFAALGLALDAPVWLGAGFILHGIWDMLHHPRVIQTKVIKWFPPICAVYDFVFAAYILTFY